MVPNQHQGRYGEAPSGSTGEGEMAQPEPGPMGVGVELEAGESSSTVTAPLLINFLNHGESCRPDAMAQWAAFGPQF